MQSGVTYSVTQRQNGAGLNFSSQSINTIRHLIRKISNGDISTTGHPIHFMFGSRVGFSGSADRMALFPVEPNPRGCLTPSFKISNEYNIWYGLCDPLS